MYDYIEHATPFVEPSLAGAGDGPALKDFTRGVWEAYATPLPAFAVPERSGYPFYGFGKKLSPAMAVAQYAVLAKTPFPSMYGAGSWAEDFAETATWTWLRESLRIEYSVTIVSGGREELVLSPAGAGGSPAREAVIRAVLD